MAEFVANDPVFIERGEPITVCNKCKSPVEVGTGFIFKKDGVYKVTVCGQNVIIETLEDNP